MSNQQFSFATSLAKNAIFKEGLRDFMEYRDLGVADATNGRFRAHVIRIKKGASTDGLHSTGLHQHDLDFQMIYILKGWIRFIHEGQGERTFEPGDCCLQPPGIVHNEIECSDDLELIEITSPAQYETAAVEK